MKSELLLKEEELIFNYQKLKNILDQWGSFVDKKLVELLSTDSRFDVSLNLEIKPLHRLKDDYKLIKKAFYRNKKYDNPLLEITDKVGTRIVVTTRKDVEIVSEIIKTNRTFWDIFEDKPSEEFILDPAKFGYQAYHFLLRPKKTVSFFDKIEEEELDYYICEVQIKSLAQHAWAQINHDTTYKGPFESDSAVIRTMAKIMAISEMSDDYYDMILDHMKDDDNIKKQYLNQLIKIAKVNLDIQFDKKSIDSSLSSLLFDNLNFLNYDLNYIEDVIIRNKDLVSFAFKKLRSYLKTQPVTVFLFALILMHQKPLFENKWPLESDVLKELYSKMNFSF